MQRRFIERILEKGVVIDRTLPPMRCPHAPRYSISLDALARSPVSITITITMIDH
jgi:hypothetical protein